MKLTEEQKNVIRNVVKFNKDIQKIAGYAGTGKSLIIGVLKQILPNFAVCAYTGKAANVLRKKDILASTIHGLIYKPVPLPDGKVIFELADNLDCSGVIIDEASMVSKEIHQDLTSFGIPLIYVGDHGQLEPIGSDFNLMKDPDFTLEKIHRNAGEIAHFAEFIRNGYKPSAFAHRKTDKVKFLSKYEASKHYQDVDQIICAYNKTRVQINEEVRHQRGLQGNRPQIGDKIMCLRNNRRNGLFNGMQGIVEEIFDYPSNKMIFSSYGVSYTVYYDPKQFGKDKYDFSHDRDDPDAFDFGDVCTCHKAQGDEWENVMGIEQKCDLWDHKRWCYTLASRTRERLWWVV